MKIIILLLLSILVTTHSYSQTSDTTKVVGSYIPIAPSSSKNYSVTAGKLASQPNESWEVKDGKNVTFKKVGFKNTEVVERIIELESQECEALKSRDSLRLMTLWARDFTLDETQSLVSNKGGIPYYISLYRMIEDVTPTDSVTVMCTGVEYQQQIGYYHSEADQKKKFFHIWTKANGIWKLSTRRLQ